MVKQLRNIEKDKINLNSFIGGMSVDYKLGIPNSFYYAQGLDFRSKPSQMSVLPGMTSTANNLSDLITCMCQDQNGVRYAVGNQGYLYKISTTGVITNFGKLTTGGAAGIVYNQLSDSVYITAQQTVTIYGPVSNNPQLRIDQFGPSASLFNSVIYTLNPSTLQYDGNNSTARNNISNYAAFAVTPTNYTTYVTNTLTNTYSPLSAISELTTNTCVFIPDLTSFYSISVYLPTIGTGNLTLTLHDSLNNVLGTSTITNGNLVSGWNNFVFSSQINVVPNGGAYTGTAAGYHFHITSSVSSDTTTVATINSGDLTGANFVLFINRLIKTNNGWHPAIMFGSKMMIGNGSFLATYDFLLDSGPPNTSFSRQQLALDPGYEVCGLSINNQYLVIAAEKRSKSGSRTFQDGFLYFWDGINSFYNFKIEIPMGAPYSLQTLNNITYFICAGSLFAWGGGQQVIKVRYLAYQNTDYLGVTDSTIVNPNMMDIRYNLMMIGYPSSTTNVNLNYGIYSWGAVELSYPNSFGYSYSSSIASLVGQNYSAANNMQFGMVKNFVDTMYLSWQYTDANSVTHYGLDLVNNSSAPATTFNWQSLIYDGGARYHRKKALRYKISFASLPVGSTLVPYYSIDRGAQISADPTSGVSYAANPGDSSVVIEFNNARFYELQWGFTGTVASSATPPIITGVTMEIDPLEDEHALRKDHT